VCPSDLLAAEGLAARVLELYAIKALDAETVRVAARETGALITVADHWPEGGIGDAVLDALAEEQPHPLVVKLAVREMPGSGTPAELLAAAGIDADHIADASRALVGRAGTRGRSTTEVGSGRRE
jgi:transketolase